MKGTASCSWRLLVISMLFVAACDQGEEGEHQTEPKWKEAYTVVECEALRDTVIERCGNGDLTRAIDVMQNDMAQCEPFGPPARLSGLWELDLEHSAFFENAVHVEEIPSFEEADESESLVWLHDPDLDQNPERLAAAQGEGRRVYRVEIIGRRSLCATGFGHLGAYPRQVILQKILSEETLSLR